jgi:hypothetical protein
VPKAGATGKLIDWTDLEDEFLEASLLLGNGLSMHVAEGFGYDALFEQAEGLDAQDQALFDQLGTTNFESALEALSTSMIVAEAFGLDDEALEQSYERIQAALGKAVRAVHVEWAQLSDETLAAIQEELLNHHSVFTTSYDLILYWAMAHEDGFKLLGDGFWGNPLCHRARQGSLRTFGKTPVHYLHGALHLVARSDGKTGKHRRSLRAVLEKFGRPMPDDPKARPLLVTEGSARHKLRVIESNEYLTFCREALVQCDDSMVVFGFSFGDNDSHIAEALNQHPTRRVAISMLGDGSSVEIKLAQKGMLAKLQSDDVYFYDASTHPLGLLTPALVIEV